MKKMKFLHSLKFRLFVILVIVGILPNIILKIGILKTYENRAVSNRSIDILSQAKMLGNQIVTYNYIQDTSSEVINTQLELLSNIYDGRVLIINNGFQVVKDTYGLDTGKTIISEEVVKSSKGQEISKYDSKYRYIEMTIPLKDTSTKEVQGIMLVSVSTDSILSNYDYLNNNALVIEIANAIIILAVALFWANHLLKPFGRMTHSLEEIQTGYGEEQLMISDYSETEAISDAFNQMLGRMRVIDESRQEFVSNVSHELKTPLTSMKVLADSLLGQEDVPAELYKEFMGDIAEEIERENKIINDLLSLVKMDKSAGSLNISVVNVNELLETIMKRLRPIAEKQNVELVLESFRPVSAEIDEVKISLALTNLVENAIKYNKPEGWVHVSLNADHKYFFVRVEDSGIGIPEESLEHIYERFYRVDKSHSREIGGTGLGLAITRNAVLMHRGAIKAHSKEGEGTIFTVRIPLTYIA
ncbi:sensor histidine kinase [Roseburia sp. MSJ-14]|uniref:sensor histidine kinase n=1 Tax=Roseburia sp. MSJ-14 TaxID=2841514 RepID=UPI001C120233|nr:HAMP domain-containing sensor histidine kinase [Roseburia sp. MSJ-14]MBU5472515.1 cell wall metabolism sensor histidine kinase WalK [Roseburia sp. MSJ-14]